MSQISVSLEEFSDVLICFLLDCLNHGSTIDNENFDMVLRKMKNAGIRSNLLQAYIDMPGSDRVRYKFVRPVLMGLTGGTTRITVANRGEIKEEVKE